MRFSNAVGEENRHVLMAPIGTRQMESVGRLTRLFIRQTEAVEIYLEPGRGRYRRMIRRERPETVTPSRLTEIAIPLNDIWC